MCLVGVNTTVFYHHSFKITTTNSLRVSDLTLFFFLTSPTEFYCNEIHIFLTVFIDFPIIFLCCQNMFINWSYFFIIL